MHVGKYWRGLIAALGCALATPAIAAPPGGVTVMVEADEIKAVLSALRNPALTMAEALRIAALPGSQGLIRKAKSYGRPGTDALFAEALIAAAHHDATAPDPGRFRFDQVRDHADAIATTLARLEDPSLRLIDGVKARIAAFTPAGLSGQVIGHLVVGGTSGGFAFGDPEFFLDLDRYPSATLAATIMEHELFHAVQAMAHAAYAPPSGATACLARVPHGEQLSELYDSLSMEGTASLVGDVGALAAGIDKPSDEERAHFMRNVGLVSRSVTQIELSVHGLNSGADVSYDDIYALGFYGDEVLYALGYVMARAIAAEQGNGAVAELSGRPGALFVERYRALKDYGKSDRVPALHAETLSSAASLAVCLHSN
jgi:Putative zinc dependent peptidase (DUF5700)